MQETAAQKLAAVKIHGHNRIQRLANQLFPHSIIIKPEQQGLQNSGFGVDTAATLLHIKAGGTPLIRLHQRNIGFPPLERLIARLGIIRPDDAKSGYQSLQWREAYIALVKADERGSPSFYVEEGGRRIYPKPGILQTLLFRFDDDAVWKKLVSKPLYAIVTVDLNSSKFLRCSFLHRT